MAETGHRKSARQIEVTVTVDVGDVHSRRFFEKNRKSSADESDLGAFKTLERFGQLHGLGAGKCFAPHFGKKIFRKRLFLLTEKWEERGSFDHRSSVPGFKKPFGVECRHAAGTGGRDGLAVLMVLHIAAGKDARDARVCAVMHDDVSFRI